MVEGIGGVGSVELGLVLEGTGAEERSAGFRHAKSSGLLDSERLVLD